MRWTTEADGTWKNHVSGQPDATTSAVVSYRDETKAFHVDEGKPDNHADAEDVIRVAVATSPAKMLNVTYEGWIKVDDGGYGNPEDSKCWMFSNAPDAGWSRAVAVNDDRFGWYGVTPGGDTKLDETENAKEFTEQEFAYSWIHIVGTFEEKNKAEIFVNGVKGFAKVANNDASRVRELAEQEYFIIGGGAGGSCPASISDVRVYDRVLTAEDINCLYLLGRRSGSGTSNVHQQARHTLSCKWKAPGNVDSYRTIPTPSPTPTPTVNLCAPDLAQNTNMESSTESSTASKQLCNGNDGNEVLASCTSGPAQDPTLEDCCEAAREENACGYNYNANEKLCYIHYTECKYKEEKENARSYVFESAGGGVG